MALFEYKAIKKNNKVFKDIIFASDLNDAKSILFKKDLRILNLNQKALKMPSLKNTEILNFTKDLLRLLEASIPLYEALIILSENSSKKLKFIILDILDNVKKGLYLSKALENHKKNFNDIYISLIKASEKIGKLEYALKELIYLLEKEIQLKKKLIASFTYPSILLAFCFMVLMALFFYIIPSLSELFEDRPLHPFTKFVISISNIFYNHKYFFLLFFLFLKILTPLIFIFNFLRKKVFNFFMNLPILKNFIIKFYIQRFFKTFATLLHGGVSYVNAYTLALNTVSYPILKNKLSSLTDSIKRGYNLSSLLKEIKIIPTMIPKMIKISENSGKLEDMFLSIANIYEEEIDRKLTKLTTLLQPIILVILGFIIGFVILSVMLPLTDVSSFLGD